MNALHALQTVRQYATAQDLSLRQVQRYLADNRLPGAVKMGGTWSIPADATPTPVGSDVVTTSPDVVGVLEQWGPPDPFGVYELRPGLWPLDEAAEQMGTSVPGLRRLVAAVPSVGTIGPFGPLGGDRLYVAP